MWVQRQHAADGGRIADRAEDIVILQHLVIRLHPEVDLADIGNVLDPGQQIRHMAQGVFDALGRRVGCPGKCAAGGDVGEIAVVEPANIQPVGRSLNDAASRLHDLLRQAQGAGKVVG